MPDTPAVPPATPLNATRARHFARAWVGAWNAHDLDRVLTHYAPDVEFRSPFAASIAGAPAGVVRGHAALRAYWSRALERFPRLRFTLLGVFTGASGLVIHYRAGLEPAGAPGLGALDLVACETLLLSDAGVVVSAAAHYNELDLDAARAHGAPLFVTHLTPILNVSDIPASLAWFARLGWRTCWQWSRPGAFNPTGTPTFAAVGAGQCEVFLCKDGQGGRGRSALASTSDDDAQERGVWMSLWVDNVDEVHARCVREGLDVTHPPTDEPWGVREFHVRHPDGHVFRVSTSKEQV